MYADEDAAGTPDLLAVARPLLSASDRGGLQELLGREGNTDRLTAMLTNGDRAAARLAAQCLAFAGGPETARHLVELLHQDDRVVWTLAENALWGIWFHAGDDRANAELHAAVEALGDERTAEAIRRLDDLIARCPRFAEAHNQRAIAHYLKDDFCRAIGDCRTTLELNPIHFAAHAGMGHCYTALSRFQDALHCYHHALQVHPHLEGIRQSIGQIRMLLARRCGPPM